VCPALAERVTEAAKASIDGDKVVHAGGSYVVIDGPMFSTRAESQIYRSWGASVIGMTNLPEAKLAREAELCYATIALSTDYDCWHHSEEDVTVEAVVKVLKQNVDLAKRIIRESVARIPAARECGCPTACDNAVMTAPDRIPPETREKLKLILGKYWK
jgi:5'-methylthioadenosine phosphorylase